eukprot:TRINITY_DN8926_c0_g1_i1.p1 TRINITY_DN8926_c0_g1~~TRINITY_DN8926_c0_g1_i1.p1  ORF type:complete len:289 (+),score=64.21 TRINITY_DN8926_c0_g1_i1:54-869(+)
MAELSSTKDTYGGRVLEIPESLGSDDFKCRLQVTLESYRNAGVRGVWLRLPAKASALVPIAANQGFEYHHAQPEYLMMTLWLPRSKSRLPAYAHHQIGVAGMVLSPDGRFVLAIQEKTGITRGRNFWKLPGGLVDHGEDLRQAVEREVEEETGVVAEFRAIAAFRETHRGPHGCSDLYVICAMQLLPEGEELPTPEPQEEEVARAEWIPLKEFLALPYYQRGLFGDMMRGAAAAAEHCRTSGRTGLVERKLPMFGRMESLYHATVPLKGRL